MTKRSRRRGADADLELAAHRLLWSDQLDALAQRAKSLGLAGDGELQVRIADARAALTHPDPIYRSTIVPQLQSLQAHLKLFASLDTTAEIGPLATALQAEIDRLTTALQPYRRVKGERRRHPAWQARVRELHQPHPEWPFPQFWDHLVDVVRTGDDVVLHEAVTGEDDRLACDAVIGRPCPPGPHLHWCDARDRLRPLDRETVRHFVQRPRP